MKKKNYVLLNKQMEEIGRYTGRAPRQAALKAANAGFTDILLRETGVRRTRTTGRAQQKEKFTEVKVHKFKGSRKQRAKGPNDPAWLPKKIFIPQVKKLGVEWMKWSS